MHRQPPSSSLLLVSAIAIAVAAVWLAGCCGGGSTDRCTATLSYNGKTGPGAGGTKAEAQHGACWKYCGDHDPEVGAAWQKWKSSGGKSKGDKFVDIADVPSLKLVQMACESQCAADIAAGKAKITFGPSCK